MGFKKIEKNTINYQPPTNDSLRLVSGNTALVTVIQQVVPLSGLTNIGSGPGYIYKQTQNQIAEMMGISGNTNISIAYNSTGDTVGVNLNDNIIVNSISATTIYSGSTDLSLLIGGGGGSFTQQYVSGSTGSQSLISISPAGTGNIAEQNSIVLSKNSSGLSTYSTIIGGSNNLINSGADYSLISGKNNTISQPYAGGTFSHILGANNKSYGSYVNIIGNYNSGYTSNSSIIGKSNLNQGTNFGAYQLIYSTYGLNNIAGSRNQIINAGLSNIHNGFNNQIQNTNYSSILNGNRNILKFADQSIAQGNYNRIYSSTYSIIFGNQNIITTANTPYRTFNTIIGANSSLMQDTKNSSIFGGSLNGITGSSIVATGMNVIIQGDACKIHGSRSTVINGFNNWILDNSQDSTIISGQDNNLIGGKNSIIFNGRLNNISYSTGVTLINVSNITTSSADTNLLITNKIKSIALTGGTTQMVVADSTGLLSVQAIPSGGSSTQQYVSGSTGSNSLISITPGPLGSSAQGNNAIALGYYNSANTLSSAIIGGEYNLITGQGKTSGILAGKYNIIHSSYSSPNANNIIIGGQRNKISGSTLNSKITSSYRSNLYSSKYSSIENSNYSTIKPYDVTQSSHCLIMNAAYSTAAGFFSNIFGGQNSIVSGTSNVVINGNQNEVRGGQNSTILNGISNEITYSSFSSVNNGFHNHINSSNYSNIIGGRYNYLSSANYSTIINSRDSKLISSASGSTIIGLRSFTGTAANTVYVDRLQVRSLTGATTRMVVADNDGLLSTQSVPAQLWTVGGVPSSVVLNNGYTTANSDYTLVAGKINEINTNSQYSSILGGIGNTIKDHSTHSAIVNGTENYIRDYGSYSFVGAGRGNYIFKAKHSVIPGGYNNRIYNNSSTTESKYNSILNGYQNKIIRGANCTVIGSYNIIGNPDGLTKYSFISGKGNRIYSSYSNILGCYGVVLSDPYTTLVDNLQILTTPLTDNNFLLNINPSTLKVGRTSFSGGSGIRITTAGGNLTVTYTGSTSSGGGATVNNGINTFTAGTSTFQSVNITGASLNNLTVTGSTSITTLSASTIYSGSTDLSALFEPKQTNYRQTLSTNYVMTSSTAVANFSFNVLAGEVYKVEMFSNFKVNNTGGMKLTLSGDCLYTGLIQGNSNTVVSNQIRPLTSSGNTTNLGTAANTTFHYNLQGVFSARTNTTIALGYAPQTNGQQITVFSGATMTLQKI